jgi:ABC-2 type transport system permease protein
MRALRLLTIGWLFHFKMLARSSFNGVLGIVYPLFFATVAFFTLFLGRSLPVIVNGFFVSAFAFAAGGAIVGIHVPARSIVPIALVIVVTSFACTGIGLATAGIGLLARDTATLDNIVFGILLVFCGVNVSLSDMPGWMSTIAQGLPLTHGIEAARKLADGAAFSHVGGLVAAEALVGLIYGLAGDTLIRTLERQSRIHATLERA